MIVSLQVPPETRRSIRKTAQFAERLKPALAAGLGAAAYVGAENVREQLSGGQLGLQMQHPGQGLAASLSGWMIDQQKPVAAIGVPGNTPAAAYAAIQEFGGTITPKNAKALAVPISDEAKKHTSPRDMEGLDLIPRKDKPPLLVRQMTRRGKDVGFEVHWVLVGSVTIAATHWLSRGVAAASGEMGEAFGGAFWDTMHQDG